MKGRTKLVANCRYKFRLDALGIQCLEMCNLGHDIGRKCREEVKIRLRENTSRPLRPGKHGRVPTADELVLASKVGAKSAYESFCVSHILKHR